MKGAFEDFKCSIHLVCSGAPGPFGVVSETSFGGYLNAKSSSSDGDISNTNELGDEGGHLAKIVSCISFFVGSEASESRSGRKDFPRPLGLAGSLTSDVHHGAHPVGSSNLGASHALEHLGVCEGNT